MPSMERFRVTTSRENYRHFSSVFYDKMLSERDDDPILKS